MSTPRSGAPTAARSGQADLTQPGANVFGENVFSTAVQRQRLPKAVYKQLQETLEAGELLDPVARRRRRHRHEGMGDGARRHALHALVPAAHRHHRREARLVLRAHGRRQRDRRVLRQGADPGRARRVLVPDRRHPGDVRGARLHGVGPHVARLHPREPERRAASASRPRSRRGPARRSTTRSRCCARWTRCRTSARARAAAVRRRGGHARVHHGRARAGVLPDRRALLLRAPGPDHHRPHAVRRQAAEGPRARRPLLRLDPRARARVHARDRAASSPASACRSRPATTRSRRRSTRSRRSSRTRTSAPTTSS